MKKTTKKSHKETIDVISKFENAYNQGKDYTSELQDLAIWIAHSIIKNLYDVSGNSTMLEFRRGIQEKINNDKKIRNFQSHYSTKHNTNGDLVEIMNVEDSDEKKNIRLAYNKAIDQTINDGYDLVQTAIMLILVEVKKQEPLENGEKLSLTRPYITTKLSQKVYIYTSDSKAWKDIKTTPIQSIFQGVRLYINSTKAAYTDPKSKYCYIEDYIKNENNGNMDAMEKIYMRLPKYSNLGNVDNFEKHNGKTIMTVSASESDFETRNRIVDNLNLTVFQMQILELLERGYGRKAISTYLGRSENSVHSAINEIRKKARKIGLEPKNKENV